MTNPSTFLATTPTLALPFLFPGQSQKEVTLNEALARIDALIHPRVLGERPDTPADPDEGDGWIVGAAATGLWSGHENALAFYVAGSWHFVEPDTAMSIFDLSRDQRAVFDGSSWTAPALPAEPAGGAVIDTEARAAISTLLQVLQICRIVPQN